MASNKFRYPPAPPNARGTFSDKLVGLQFHDGGELTQSNFEFTTKVVQRVTRIFDNGEFSEPLTLDDIKDSKLNGLESILSNEFTAIPNFSKSKVTNFALYGSTQKRFTKAITQIINFFPAGIEVNKLFYDYTTDYTAYDITYLPAYDTTEFKINVNRIKNPFGIDYTINSSVNIKNKEDEVSEIRDIVNNYNKYSVFHNENEYIIVDFIPSETINSGYITIEVEGNFLQGNQETEDTILIRPNDETVTIEYKKHLDEIETFFVNRNVRPKYTSVFEVIKEGESGKLYKTEEKAKWPIDGLWNIDIRTESFDRYLHKLNKISLELDEFKTNLITRFLTAGTLKDFDTKDQKFEKILQLYGRNFDEIKKYIDALSHINSVNYKVKDDIPSELLKDLTSTLGWNKNISPEINQSILESIFGGEQLSLPNTDNSSREVSYQYYRNLILNSAYLFKSKGTLRAVRNLLDLVGIPRQMVEIDELVYIASSPISRQGFENRFEQISGGTRVVTSTILDTQNNISFLGNVFPNSVSVNNYYNVNQVLDDYPIDENGYPTSPINTEDMFYQKGAGWYKSTPQHRSLELVDQTNSTFIGENINIQTTLEPFTYGEKYLDTFRNFPNLGGFGFNIQPQKDNKKSWVIGVDNDRQSDNGGLNASYYVSDERLVINCKNLDVSLNMGLMITNGLWNISGTNGMRVIDSGRRQDLERDTFNYGGEDFNNFAENFWGTLINVRNRMYNSGYNYPLLQVMFYDYNQYDTNSYSYESTIDYANDIGDYWMRLIEQLIPATTLWTGGIKFENNVLHRQSHNWRRQRKYYNDNEETPPLYYNGGLTNVDCEYIEIECDITYNNQQTDLVNTINSVVSQNGFSYSDCDIDTMTTEWLLVIKINDIVEYEGKYYDGFGISDYPSQEQWENEINTGLDTIQTYNIGHEINNNIAKVFNIDCNNELLNDSISFESKINLTINCG